MEVHQVPKVSRDDGDAQVCCADELVDLIGVDVARASLEQLVRKTTTTTILTLFQDRSVSSCSTLHLGSVLGWLSAQSSTNVQHSAHDYGNFLLHTVVLVLGV